LDSSGNSNHSATPHGTNDVPKFNERGRFRGHRGGVITMHRALARFLFEPSDLVMAALLVILFSMGWIASLPWLCRMWAYVLGGGIRVLALHATLGLSERHVTPFIHFVIPFPRMDGISPDAWTWWSTFTVVCALYAASYFFPKKITPVTYILRAVLFIQFTALVYFLVASGRFPHTPDSYMEGLVAYQIALVSAVPLLFGLTYYIFKFDLLKKIALTVLTMVHLSLFLPVQILLQAMVLQKSVLFMPVLYIVFGLPADILVILAFYSWGMSWPSETKAKSSNVVRTDRGRVALLQRRTAQE
jgi:hypothetical protein